MKKDFFDIMLQDMEDNPDVYLIFVDLGFPRYDEFKTKYPDRVINTGASEQTAVDISIGLAYSNKIVFIYTITPFFFRAFEGLRTYVNHEQLHVIMVGAGRDDDYSKHDGFSHDATDIKKHFDLMDQIEQYYPNDREDLEKAINLSLVDPFPSFISLIR